jgi:predicted ATPase
MEILAEQAAHGALVLISTHSDHIAILCDRAI